MRYWILLTLSIVLILFFKLYKYPYKAGDCYKFNDDELNANSTIVKLISRHKYVVKQRILIRWNKQHFDVTEQVRPVYVYPSGEIEDGTHKVDCPKELL